MSKDCFARGTLRAIGTLRTTGPQKVDIGFKANNLFILSTGVIRQGDGRGPANGDFVSFLAWLPWDEGEEWFGLGQCLFLYADPVDGKPNRSGMWNDSICTHLFKYICERTAPPEI